MCDTEKGFISAKELEENIGRLVHMGLVLPFVHNFLNRLHKLHRRAMDRRQIKVTEIHDEDLKLMLFFL